MNCLIRNITIENQKINREQFFAIGYCPEIEKHLLCVHISWIAGYDRYYRTEKLIGAGALRDYDFRCLPDKVLKTLDKYPPFEGYYYQDGIFYARIKIGDTFFSIPPVRDDKQM